MARLGNGRRPRGSRRDPHVALLTPLVLNALSEDVDALVIPTNRPVSYLAEAVDLAQGLNCPLVVLCSGESRAREIEVMFENFVGVAITISSTPRHRLLALSTQRQLSFLAEPYLDTANKRNIALLLGRMLGWRRLMFLDDDIRDLSELVVGRVNAAMAGQDLDMVGWRYLDFPDNSVACHAVRSSGGAQDVFIGAGSLLVQLAGWLPFFPAIYNEDWLFCHDHVARRRVGVVPGARQLAYDPFDGPQRATQQEFGDVLAEGLYELIHQRRSVLVGCLPGYWSAVIEERRRVLLGIDQRLWRLRRRRTHTWNGYQIAKVQRSVAASLGSLESVTAQDLAEFTSLWRYDLYCWNARLHQLPRLSRMSEALNWLELHDAHLVGIA